MEKGVGANNHYLLCKSLKHNGLARPTSNCLRPLFHFFHGSYPSPVCKRYERDNRLAGDAAP